MRGEAVREGPGGDSQALGPCTEKECQPVGASFLIDHGRVRGSGLLKVGSLTWGRGKDGMDDIFVAPVKGFSLQPCR